MVNPVYIPFAFMGGRSWSEIVSSSQSKAMDSSIAIGIGGVLSAAIIFCGQTLFWGSLPSTAPVAVPVALVLTVVYAMFYRLVIRASEVAGGIGKVVLTGAAFSLAGVNALLAGHEVVLIPFDAQVREMTVHLGSSQVDAMRSQTESSLGLGALRERTQQARQDEVDARERLNTVPAPILEQQQQAQACDQRAQRMRAALPELESPGRDRAVTAWREQRRECAKLNASARSALNAHRAEASERLEAAAKRQRAISQKLTEAEHQTEEAVAKTAPIMTASATTGFGRHEALWAAVKAGKVPAWAAYGLMLLALCLEGAGLLLKLILPKDEATYARLVDVRIIQAVGNSELAYARAYQAQIKPAMVAQAAQTQAAAERMVRGTLGPSMNTRFAADQFARAAASTRQAQRRSGQAAAPVMDELAKVMPGHWATAAA